MTYLYTKRTFAFSRQEARAKIEHRQDAHAFAVSARLHALRADPQHAGTSAQAIDGKIRRSSVHNRRFSNRHYGIKMRGWLSSTPAREPLWRSARRLERDVRVSPGRPHRPSASPRGRSSLHAAQ